jgi:hypothetical protein
MNELVLNSNMFFGNQMVLKINAFVRHLLLFTADVFDMLNW